MFILQQSTMPNLYKRTFILSQIWKNEIFFHVCSTNGKQSSSYLQRITLRKIKAEIGGKENFFQTRNSWNISNSATSNSIFRRRVITRKKSLICFDTIWYQICIIEMNIIELNAHSKAISLTKLFWIRLCAQKSILISYRDLKIKTIKMRQYTIKSRKTIFTLTLIPL